MHVHKLLLSTAASIAVLLASPGVGTAETQVRWDVQAHFPSTLPQTGEAMHRLTRLLGELSDGQVQLSIAEPGALSPPGEILASLQVGALDAGFSAPGFWAGQEPALQVFGGLPFGPPAEEFLAWFWGGEGEQIYHQLYDQFNIHAVPCGLIPQEAAGWFSKQINSTEDLRGLTIRIFGLGGLVLEKFGASPQLLPVGDTLPALELGTIDAAELVTPSIDYALGVYQFADYYYFPGWHQQTTITDLLVNKDSWAQLSQQQQTLIKTICTDNVTYALATGLAAQPEALQAIEARGITPQRLPEEVLTAIREAWGEVVEEQRQGNENFRLAWDSLQEFRNRHQTWTELQKLD